MLCVNRPLLGYDNFLPHSILFTSHLVIRPVGGGGGGGGSYIESRVITWSTEFYTFTVTLFKILEFTSVTILFLCKK
jgi:hypothetical protein